MYDGYVADSSRVSSPSRMRYMNAHDGWRIKPLVLLWSKALVEAKAIYDGCWGPSMNASSQRCPPVLGSQAHQDRVHIRKHLLCRSHGEGFQIIPLGLFQRDKEQAIDDTVVISYVPGL